MKANELGVPTYNLKVTCGAYCLGGSVDYEPTNYPEHVNADEVWVKGEDVAALAALCQAEAESKNKFFDEAVALKARLAEAEQDIEQWKKVYDLRGRALQRPCINCGYVPQVIRPADSADEVQP